MFISLVLQKSAKNDIMSSTYQFLTPRKRKFTDTKVVVFTEGQN
jgi:SNF family Na+-dependent transporter